MFKIIIGWLAMLRVAATRRQLPSYFYWRQLWRKTHTLPTIAELFKYE